MYLGFWTKNHCDNKRELTLGCMAERLKTKILDKEKAVDLICGPDAYKDLPRMLADVNKGQTSGSFVLLFIYVISISFLYFSVGRVAIFLEELWRCSLLISSNSYGEQNKIYNCNNKKLWL